MIESIRDIMIMWVLISFTIGLLNFHFSYLKAITSGELKIKHIIYFSIFLPLTLCLLFMAVIVYSIAFISNTKTLNKINVFLDKDINWFK